MIDITTQADFENLCAQIQSQPYLSLDTEFIREKTFQPNLALLQVAWPEADPILIDPLKIQDWSCFHSLMLDPDIVKIFHAGRQDIEIFFNQMGRIPVNIYDTQIAAAFLGFGEQIGYGNLVMKVTGVELTKGDSYTDWMKRPLTESQISYARNDVAFLGTIYERLNQMANELGRLTWIREETEETYCDNLFQPQEDDLWKKVKKCSGLRAHELPVLQEIARWRFQAAKKANKPVRFVAKDEVLISLSHRKQLDEKGLLHIRGLSTVTRRDFGAELVEAVQRGLAKPKEDWPKPLDRSKPYPEHIEVIAELAWVLVKETSTQMNLGTNLIIAKKALSEVVAQAIRGKLSPEEGLIGWRKEVLGKKLRMLLEGEMALLVKNGKLAFHPFNDSNTEPL